jgi:NADPH:quinone reductase-like Zn-dependent oxidoreductase
MADLAARLANLSPEQRAKLAERLVGPAKNPAPQDSKTPDRSGWENYGFGLGAPGNFGAIQRHQMDSPAPGPGQIQLEAKAVSLNFRDLMIAMGLYPAAPGVPSVMGSDYAGIVRACGEGVTVLKEGDRVAALSVGSMTPEGAIIEDGHFCAVPLLLAEQAVPIPDALTFEAAAGIPTVFATSYYALCHVARIQPGERVLIHTATGGVGLSALQIAKWTGAAISATAGSPEKREMLTSLGIDGPMDSRSVAFADEIMEATGGEGVDVILNTLSGEAVRRGLEILRPFGRFLQIDKKDISEGAPLDLTPFNKGLNFTAIDLSLFMKQPGRMNALLREVVDHLGQGHFDPVQTAAFPVDNIGDVFTLMSRYQHTGKLVLTYD